MTLRPAERTGAVVAPPAVDVRSLSRRFGATLAVDDVDLTLESGGIHALVGENGAGKSTLLGMLSGRVSPSSGSVRIHGVELAAGDPRAARRHGLAAIYQELTILPALTAEENVVVGGPPSTVGVVDRRATRAAYASLSARLGVAVAPTSRAGSLAVAQQQQLEIMRALHADARLLLLDEPTAALGAAEREGLLELMDQLRRDGVTMVFVSHNLDEVLRISDTVTVFRDGRLVETGRASQWDKDALVAAMLGSSATVRDDEPEQRVTLAGAPSALTVRRLAVPGRLHALDLEVKEGEILGIAGLVGAGRTTLLRALSGLEPSATGTITVGGRGAGPLPSSPRQAWRRGMALVPENRKDDGLVLGQPAMLNATLADLGRAGRWGLFSRQRMRAQALEAATPVGVAASALDKRAGALSGGNQQKLLLARCLHRRPRVLLADEPTRGVDIGAKQEILAALRALAADGVAVVVVSSEIETVLAIADRVVVLARGRLVRDYDRCDGFDQSAVLHAAFDHTAALEQREGS